MRLIKINRAVKKMKEIVADKALIAYCGLYCGACRKYLKEKCPGCAKNETATWCDIRKCCMENKYNSCADCKTFQNVSDCKKFNNLISKVIGFIFRSDRKACVNLIKDRGYHNFAEEMSLKKAQTIRKKLF